MRDNFIRIRSTDGSSSSRVLALDSKTRCMEDSNICFQCLRDESLSPSNLTCSPSRILVVGPDPPMKPSSGVRFCASYGTTGPQHVHGCKDPTLGQNVNTLTSFCLPFGRAVERCFAATQTSHSRSKTTSPRFCLIRVKKACCHLPSISPPGCVEIGSCPGG